MIAMKSILTVLLLLAPSMLSAAEPEAEKAKVPQGPLNAMEKKFVGKWQGKRSFYQWEIERRADRTFEIAFVERDSDRPAHLYENWASGVWWIEDKQYYYEWKEWKGEEGDFSGVATELVDKVKDDMVVTLTEGEDDPRNIETRVKNFVMKAWRLKPKAAKAQEQPEKQAGQP